MAAAWGRAPLPAPDGLLQDSDGPHSCSGPHRAPVMKTGPGSPHRMEGQEEEEEVEGRGSTHELRAQGGGGSLGSRSAAGAT